MISLLSNTTQVLTREEASKQQTEGLNDLYIGIIALGSFLRLFFNVFWDLFACFESNKCETLNLTILKLIYIDYMPFGPNINIVNDLNYIYLCFFTVSLPKTEILTILFWCSLQRKLDGQD